MTFDGIPFEDTNSPTHHSWANFPSGWTASADFDRSPGLASTFGPTNFGGSINLQSPQLYPDPDIRASLSYGSWNKRLLQLDADPGFFGKGNRNSFLMDIQQLLSDGYRTFNYQKRVAGCGKYQYRFSDRASLTLYGGLVDIWTNTPTRPTQHAGRWYSMATTICWTAPPSCPPVNRTPTTPGTALITSKRTSNTRPTPLTLAMDGSSTPKPTPPANGGMWVQDAPSNVESLSLLWMHKNFDFGFIEKRVGQMYNDNGTLTQWNSSSVSR
jgi:hypothetical protein